eukprot:1527642-Lingulodinium_polyedra.AAC.1
MAHKSVSLPRSGQVGIADFGAAFCARVFVVLFEQITTKCARAPEAFLGGRANTSAVDLWAFGSS